MPWLKGSILRIASQRDTTSPPAGTEGDFDKHFQGEMDLSAQSVLGSSPTKIRRGLSAEQSRDHFGHPDVSRARPVPKRQTRVASFWGMQIRGRGVGKALFDQSSGRLDFTAGAGSGQRWPGPPETAAWRLNPSATAGSRLASAEYRSGGQDGKQPRKRVGQKGLPRAEAVESGADLRKGMPCHIVARWFPLAQSGWRGCRPSSSRPPSADVPQASASQFRGLLWSKVALTSSSGVETFPSELAGRSNQVTRSPSRQSTHHV